MGTNQSVQQRIDEPIPVGIIISQGSRAEDAPRFAAYIWAPAPTDAEVRATTRAA